jgi:hypothetical protein
LPSPIFNHKLTYSIITTASSNQTADIAHATHYKLCSRCAKRKILGEFIRFYRNQEKEWSTCNDCSEKKKGKRTKPDTEQELLNQPEYIADDIVNLEKEIESMIMKTTFCTN